VAAFELGSSSPAHDIGFVAARTGFVPFDSSTAAQVVELLIRNRFLIVAHFSPFLRGKITVLD
jgi:hypothetical protein